MPLARAAQARVAYDPTARQVIGAVFSCTECFVEKARGRTDRWNPVVGGCITGAVLAHGSGPQGMALGCGGFAAFSYAIDALGFGQFD